VSDPFDVAIKRAEDDLARLRLTLEHHERALDEGRRGVETREGFIAMTRVEIEAVELTVGALKAVRQ
jgi:hypothetical protein